MANQNAATGHDLGLEDYQQELLAQLLAQADERGIPREVLPILARHLDRIDFDRITVGAAGAAEILRVGERQVYNLVETNLEWMSPLTVARDAAGQPRGQLWLASKLRAFQRVRTKK